MASTFHTMILHGANLTASPVVLFAGICLIMKALGDIFYVKDTDLGWGTSSELIPSTSARDFYSAEVPQEWSLSCIVNGLSH